MRSIKRWSLALVLPALIVVAAQAPRPWAGQVAAAPHATITPPQPTLPPARPGRPPKTEGQPIHMPNLIGRTLDYATNIWDDDEPLPQISVNGVTTGPNLVIVGQQPAPGTMIHPENTKITLTLGRGPAPAAPTRPPSAAPRAAVAGQATLLRAPYVQSVAATSLVIVWTTVEDGPSQVQYGQNDYAQTAAATSALFTSASPAPYDSYYVHQATLSGLAPDTSYQYKISTNGVDLTPNGSVTTRTAKPASTSHFRLAVFGDSGDGSQDQLNMATRLLQINPDLAIHTGDIIYNEATYDGYETKYFQIYKDLIKSVWVAPAMGNHDVTYNNGKSFTDVFVNPPNATNQSDKELYYSFDYGNAHFTILNNYFSMSTVGSAQYNWLQNDLASTNQFWKFVVFHVPAYTSNSLQQANDNAAIVQNLVPLFEQYHVNVVLNGHQHYYERMKPLLGGQVSTIDAGGVVYVVTGGGGAGLFSIGTGTLNPRTAAKVQEYHVSMFDVNGCSLQLQAVRTVSGPNDSFDPSDVFDNYTIDRCGTSNPTNTPAVTNTPTNTPAATNTPTNTPAVTNTPTNTPAVTNTPTNTPSGSPTVFFSDGFESGDMAQWSKVNGVVVQQQEVYAGTYAARSTSTGAVAYAAKQLSSAQSDLYTRLRFKMLSQSASSVTLLSLRTAGNSALLGLYVTGGGRLGYQNYTTASGFTSSTTVSAGAWHELQVHLSVNGTSSQTEVWLDGTRISALSRTDSFGTTAVGRIQIGDTASGIAWDLVFDDVAVSTSQIGP